MNIDEYRALKAELEKSEEVTENAQTEHQPTETTETEQEKTPPVQNEVDEETNPEETSATQEQTNQEEPTTVEIDGENYTLEELKGGFMRQSDYTRKTQEIRRKEREVQEAIQFMENLQQNPQVAEQLSQQFQMPNLDPRQAQFRELEDKYYDLLIEKEVNTLTQKYGEFDVREVLETARDNNINDLDVAYHIVQARTGGGQKEESVDVDTLRNELREEILAELKSQQEANADTSTIIRPGGGGAPIEDNAPKVSPQEAKVARMMGLGVKEYAKWRDGKR